MIRCVPLLLSPSKNMQLCNEQITQIAMIQRSASVHPAHGNERASAGAPPAFRPRVRYKLHRSKPRRLPSRVTLAHRRRYWHTSALKAWWLPARVPPAWRQRHWQWKTSAPSHANHVTRTLHWLPPSLRGVLASARWVNQYFVQFEHCYLTTTFTKSCIKQYRLFLHLVLMAYYEYKEDLCG